MVCFRNSLLGMLVGAVVVCAAGYSEPTRKAFMQDCTREGSEKECSCVLDKIQNKYSEKEYLKYNADMAGGKEDVELVSFIVGAATACVLANEGEDLPQGSAIGELSDEDMKLLFNTMKQELPKKDFVQGCAPEAKDVIGDKMAREVCGCAYDRMMGDYGRFVKTLKEEGMPGVSDTWGVDYVIECVPEKFTPEVEQNLIKYLNNEGIPKSTSQCLLNLVKKEYTLRAFIAASVKNSESFQMILIGLATKCLGEL